MADPTQRRRPIVAKEWQLAVLKKLQSESRNPTEEQRSVVAAETGLDEKWVRSWFTRQRSKLAARNKKKQTASTAPTFKLQLYPAGVTPTDPAPYLPSPVSVESPLPSSPSSTIPCSPQSTSTVSNASQKPTLVPHATTMPTYSRDPLCNRYPDFSRFFHAQVHERCHTFELSTPTNDPNRPVTSLDMAPHTSMHFPSLVDPLRLGGLAIDQISSMHIQLQACPVSFSMRLVDLLHHPLPTRYPFFAPP